MPEKTHVGLGFRERCSLAKAPADEIRATGKRPRTAEVFPFPNHAKFFDP